MAIPFPNLYHLKTVADSSSKACYVCHKPSTKVLITADNKDFFYVCPTHLKERGFASPVVDEKEEAARREKEALQLEIELVKKEYEQKLKKKSKKKSKDEDGEKKDGEAGTGDVDDEAVVKKERDVKIQSLTAKAEGQSQSQGQGQNDGPREFVLHRTFYQMRLDRRSNLERARRDQQRLNDPSFFPSAPKGGLS